MADLRVLYHSAATAARTASVAKSVENFSSRSTCYAVVVYERASGADAAQYKGRVFFGLFANHAVDVELIKQNIGKTFNIEYYKAISPAFGMLLLSVMLCGGVTREQ